MDDALVSVMASLLFFVYIGLFVGVITICIKIKDILYYFERKSLYSRLEKERCIVSDTEDLKKLFTLTPKEICIGEGVETLPGRTSKKISSIKDAPTRIGAENNGILSFAISKTDGTAYKILKFNDDTEIYYYIIDYTELNRYLEMSGSASEKYKRITKDNWQQV